ncbi:MAG: hypothetical protein KGL42_08800 [Betaproteobacteria bacterium]|nr:hypothetical protein [Betaproteobacteria bacterium]
MKTCCHIKPLPRSLIWAAACAAVALAALVYHPSLTLLVTDALLVPWLARAEFGVNPFKAVPETVATVAAAACLGAALLAAIPSPRAVPPTSQGASHANHF